MSPTRTDDDLERLLRATLSTQARTVMHGPTWSQELTGDRHGNRHQRWLAPLAAAAVVLALIAAFVVVRSNRDDTPTATPSSPDGPDLTTFAVPGYPEAGVLFDPNYRAVAVRTPGGVKSKNKADAVVFVFRTGGYSLHGFHRSGRVSVGGRPGYRGAAPAIANGDNTLVPTIAWHYAPDRWAVVQSIEGQRAPATATMLRLAAAAVPQGHLDVPIPFRFTAVPAGFHVYRAETLAAMHGVVVTFRNARGVMLTVTSASRDSALAQGMLGNRVQKHGNLLVVVDASEPKVPATATDQAAAAQLQARLVWEPSTLDRVVP